MEDTREMHSKLGMVIVLLCGALVVMFNSTLLSPALPTIMDDFGVSATTAQWLTSAFTMTEAVVIPLSAYLLGKFSTKRLFLAGIGIFTFFTFVASMAPSFPVLLVARALQAVGSGIVMPMTVTLIMLIFPREKRGTAMGLVTLVIGFAPAVGPTLGGLVVDAVGWRMLFGFITICGLLLLLFGSRFVQRFEGFEGYSLDIPSVVLMVCGMVALLYGISSITSSANVVVPILLMIVGLALLAVFVRRQLTLEQPMLKVSVLASGRFRTDVIAVMVMQAAMVGGSVILPLYVQNVLGYSAMMSGLVMLPGAVLGAIIGLLSGRIYDRFGVRKVTVIGVTIMALAGIGTATFAMDTSIAYVCVVFTFFSFACQMITTPLNTWGVNSLDNDVVQHANSLSNSLNQVASSIGTALLTALTALGAFAAPGSSTLEQTYMGDHIAWCGLAALTIICALIVYIFVHDKKTQPASETEPADTAEIPSAPATAAVTGTAAPAHAVGNTESWTVADAMDRNPKYVRSDQNVGDAFALFAETETDGVPVVDAEKKVVGYLSDGDVLKYLGKRDMNYTGLASNINMVVDDERIQDTLVEMCKLDVMSLATRKAITLDRDMSLEEACSVFVNRKLKKAPVVVNGKLVGSLSRRNIVRFVSNEAQIRLEEE